MPVSSANTSSASHDVLLATIVPTFLSKIPEGKLFLMQHQHDGGKPLPVDVYGSGEDMQAIKKQAKEDGLAITFHSGIDHLDEAIHPYRSTLSLFQDLATSNLDNELNIVFSPLLSLVKSLQFPVNMLTLSFLLRALSPLLLCKALRNCFIF